MDTGVLSDGIYIDNRAGREAFRIDETRLPR